MFVGSINHPRHPLASEGAVIGPFHTHDSQEKDNGAVLHNDPMQRFIGSVLDQRYGFEYYLSCERLMSGKETRRIL